MSGLPSQLTDFQIFIFVYHLQSLIVLFVRFLFRLSRLLIFFQFRFSNCKFLSFLTALFLELVFLIFVVQHQFLSILHQACVVTPVLFPSFHSPDSVFRNHISIASHFLPLPFDSFLLFFSLPFDVPFLFLSLLFDTDIL